MRLMTIFSLLALFISFTPMASAAPVDPSRSTQQLKKEIAAIMHKQDLTFLQHPVEKVSVEFLINARNELVVLHVEGENETTCKKIKEVLGHQAVRYQQPRQLMRYKVELRLVK
jgi:hypothetical protein